MITWYGYYSTTLLSFVKVTPSHYGICPKKINKEASKLYFRYNRGDGKQYH
jgi:hypothetical protein